MRCAIYTRKSSAEGLDREFTSLDNQRLYCAAWIASQATEGFLELPERYDDGGVSGGTLDRPALSSLRQSISAGCVDIVVVHKIDRLSRSLRDFANLVAEFERAGVTFVSVTQSFNTATAMGRLTLNMLLSFAQFEREMTSERLRDFFASAARRGLWINGKRPFGYRVIDNRLIVDPDEARMVRAIFRRCVRLRSLRLVVDELNRRGITNRNGTRWTDTIVHRMLRNRVYRGERRGLDQQLHEPIISEAEWQRAAQTLVAGRHFRRRRNPSALSCLLHGLIVDRSGRLCSPAGRGENGTYRYYCESTWRAMRPSRRLMVRVVDGAVVEMLDRLLGTPAPGSRSPAETLDLVKRMVQRVEVGEDAITVRLTTGATVAGAIQGQCARPVAKRWRLVSPEGEYFDFVNLSLWLRSNAHRFSAVDVAPIGKGGSSSNAHLGLSRLRPEAKPRRAVWKGWRWHAG